MSITHLDNTAQLDGILGKSKDKLSVIDFHATWCGPCHMIAPTFEALAKQYPNANFLKCDVDQAKDIAGRYRITAMPTFIFLKGTSEVERVRGANKPALEAAVRRHSSGSSSGTFSGKGHTLGDGSSNPGPGPVGGGGVAAFQALDPQVKVLLYLLGGYLVFWWLK
ncbi:thioredoxin-like protein [Trametes versicolor FP-101664 SS1]|uniref:thioredoxin-like protein n=1 Tax=Trametes versicolor (strain FP-101664) TaxID=717944 RepID=UPI000462466D|nr:thioredoxin-like protein [Trametes versicolor FP-101664 SS1]EIW63963.1 thioredoxin-like protein [Trametes versicolor FP-101664 SS1]